MKELELRAGNVAKAFLDHELGDYTHFEHKIESIEEIGDRSYLIECEVTDCYGLFKSIGFRITFEEELKNYDEEDFDVGCEIEVRIYDDNFEKVVYYKPSIKYFWIALLQNTNPN